MGQTDEASPPPSTLHMLSLSFLVTGNVLGVGVLALPIKAGVAGFVPAMVGMIGIWVVMLTSAFVIANRLPANVEKVDLPSFYHAEVGQTGKWLAIACNLILLYGVLIAYLSGISTIIDNLGHVPLPDWAITVLYFVVATSSITIGMQALQRGALVVVGIAVVVFVVMIATGLGEATPEKLEYMDWEWFPIGLPIAVSAFHFHNIIPTVSRRLNHDLKRTKRAIVLGVGVGLVMNVVWVAVALATLPEFGENSIHGAYSSSHPATIPMAALLQSPVFEGAGVFFALFAVTASYMANGAGLLGFNRDLLHTYLKTSSRLLALAVTFLPPLAFTLVYPDVFLSALDIVGGIGESILFIVLPAVILIRLRKPGQSLKLTLSVAMLLIGIFVVGYVLAEQFGASFTVVGAGPP